MLYHDDPALSPHPDLAEANEAAKRLWVQLHMVADCLEAGDPVPRLCALGDHFADLGQTLEPLRRVARELATHRATLVRVGGESYHSAAGALAETAGWARPQLEWLAGAAGLGGAGAEALRQQALAELGARVGALDFGELDTELEAEFLHTAEARRRAPAAEVVAPPASEPAERLSWQEVADRLERLRAQGEPFTSQGKLAEQLGCSTATIHKAITRTPALQRWAKPEGQTASGRAQGLNEVATDSTPQSREPNPEDEAAVREFIEQAGERTRAWFHALAREDQLRFLAQPAGTRKRLQKYLESDLRPDERAFFEGLRSLDQQLDYLDDPDKHQKILGRKP
jgi:hypothetical protein